ncbi:MAG: SDR family NAD(P)-dependent oxidoreductase [Pseudomonadota bacterium]
MLLKDQIVLVTGGGSGIGLELSKQLAALGNTMFICGRNVEKLKAAEKAYGLKVVPADVTFAEDQQAVLKAIETAHGRLDLLINNAGVLLAYDFASQEDAVSRIESEIGINAIAPVTLAKRALPLLSLSQAPAILFVGSGSAYVPVAGAPVYSGTKAFIHHTAQGLRHQLKDVGISVFEVLPPVIATDMGNSMKSKNLKVMEPADLVSDILKGLASDNLEMVPGQSRQLRLLSRIMPGYLFRQIAKTRFH